MADKRVVLRKNLTEALTKLRSLWHEEFTTIQDEVEKLNKDQTTIKIVPEFKANKDKFKDYLKSTVKGSGLRGDLIDSIADSYPDLIEVYNDFGV